VYMRGNVQLKDNKANELWSNEVTYNLRTKIGQYLKDGTLISDQTMVSSKQATYNMKTKDARFKENVIVNDPEYYVVSRDLGYNTDNKIATFFGPSIVTNENSMLQTSNGYYVTGDKTSKFWSRTSILNDGQYIESDTLFYTKSSGWAHAFGNVIIIDTSEHNSTMYSEYAEYNEISKQMLAYYNPVIKYITDKEIYYYRADTFFSEPVKYEPIILTAQDSIQKSIDEIQNAIEKKDRKATEGLIEEDYSIEALLGLNTPDHTNDSISKNNDTVMILPDVDIVHYVEDLEGRHRNRKDIGNIQDALSTSKKDSVENKINAPTFTLADSLNTPNQTFYNYPTTENDTATKRYFLGYHNVKIYSDSLQGIADSMKYNQADSLITFYKKPILWNGNNQIKGDIILLQLDSSELKEMILPKNGIVISKAGPDNTGFFDQIQGNFMKSYLSNGNIDSLVAERDAMNIYYLKDDDDFYSGVNKSSSDRIEALFVNEEIKTITYRGPTDGETIPMTEINPESLRLERFFWHNNLRIESLEQFLDGKMLKEPILFRWESKKSKTTAPALD
jgi:lipopolysaccharide export system protein LptA